MHIEHTKLADKIHLLTFDSQQNIASTFCRFQEHYESPNFREKIFSLEEFQKWYIQNSPNGRKTGDFTYYSDWNGFNIPSSTLQPFYDGRFNPLSDAEKRILDMFENETGVFYIIGIHKGTEKIDQLLRHETAHGLFYTNDDYRTQVLSLLSWFDIGDIKEELRLMGGYHEEVLNDEVHAYSIDSTGALETPIPEELSRELRRLYETYLKRV